MIFRTFFCLNKNCRHQFTVTDSMTPACPRCKGRRTQWIPMTTGIISTTTRNIDRTVKETAPFLGNKNYKSPRMGEAMAPRVGASVAHTRKYAPASHPQWGIEVPATKDGQLTGQSACAPTGVTLKVPTPLNGARVKGNPKLPHVSQRTAVEARHRGTL